MVQALLRVRVGRFRPGCSPSQSVRGKCPPTAHTAQCTTRNQLQPTEEWVSWRMCHAGEGARGLGGWLGVAVWAMSLSPPPASLPRHWDERWNTRGEQNQ